MSSHQVTWHMETSRSQDRSVTPRKKRRERDGTRGSREPLGTLGSLSYLSYCYPLLIYIHAPRYHTTATPATTFFCIAYSPADETSEIPELPLQNSRQKNDAKKDEGEDHTYEPLPFDTPGQQQ